MLWLQELPAPHQLQQEVAADWEWRFGIIAREIWDHCMGDLGSFFGKFLCQPNQTGSSDHPREMEFGALLWAECGVWFNLIFN